MPWLRATVLPSLGAESTRLRKKENAQVLGNGSQTTGAPALSPQNQVEGQTASHCSLQDSRACLTELLEGKVKWGGVPGDHGELGEKSGSGHGPGPEPGMLFWTFMSPTFAPVPASKLKINNYKEAPHPLERKMRSGWFRRGLHLSTPRPARFRLGLPGPRRLQVVMCWSPCLLPGAQGQPKKTKVLSPKSSNPQGEGVGRGAEKHAWGAIATRSSDVSSACNVHSTASKKKKGNGTGATRGGGKAEGRVAGPASLAFRPQTEAFLVPQTP